MDSFTKEKKNNNKKGNLITKTWERCKSFSRGGSHPSTIDTDLGLTRKSKSWHDPVMNGLATPGRSYLDHRRRSYEDDGKAHRIKGKHKVAPQGCFSVYVGPQKERFVVKTEYANHPLFRMLLEEAETEYGYSNTGPLELPCDVEVFRRILMELDSDDDGVGRRRKGCGFVHGGGGGLVGAYRLLSPSRMMVINQY
ncbi:hypothetical protein SAY86_032187 [Trapa natans]|uniref:Uncharacterized protein n=1 Tax=Trapa natans TaxID=22666 RepID=A0AAN7LVD5_TRANT|nr:hypothetical protein SAY86_032187 [Trapa natans]